MSEEQHNDTSGWIRGRQGSREPREMSIYVISETNSDQPCKIGSAADVGRRICTLNSGNPRQLVIRSIHPVPWLQEEKWLAYQKRVQELERLAHKRLDRFKMRGEWFLLHWQDAGEAVKESL